MNGDPRVTSEEQGTQGIVHDTNPVHLLHETYDDYAARIEAQGVEPASEAEWANAQQVLVNDPQAVEEEASAEDEEADLEEHLQELEGDEDDEDEEDEDE